MQDVLRWRPRLQLAGLMLLLMLSACLTQQGSEELPELTLEAVQNDVEKRTSDLSVSAAIDREGARILDTAVIEGDVYIYVNDKDVGEAAFYLNDPERQGEPYNVEDSGALDLEPSYALFDSTTLEDGIHTLTTALKKGDETRVVTATFLVDNGGAWRGQLLVSAAPERTDAQTLAGRTLSGDAYIYLMTDEKAEQVIFKIDGELSATERQPFYDLRGTRQEDGLAQGLDLSDIGAGEHTVTAEVTAASGETRTTEAQFVVDENSGENMSGGAESGGAESGGSESGGSESGRDSDVNVPEDFTRWSDSATWDGQVPAEDADVTIAADQAVLLDTDVKLGRVTVEGTLRCAEQDLDLQADLIMVMGRFECGTEEEPFTESLTLTLTGDKDQMSMNMGMGMNMDMGSRVLGVMEGGELSLQAPERSSWSQLTATAEAGDDTLQVADTDGWRVGDEIVVASTDFDFEQAEKRTITDVSGGRVTLDEPLETMHFGETQSFGGQTLDERAEVGLLSRTITVQGAEGSEEDGFGGHMMIMKGGRAELANIELQRMGQRGEMGRYPVHFHLNGDTSEGSYLRGSSIHTSFNRCVTIHGSNGVEVTDNVAYDAPGHCYFLEDGIEEDNVFESNLGLGIYEPEDADALLPSDADDFRGPAVYWITNPNNTFKDNVAAGSAGTGFWVALPEHPTGLSATDDVWPRQIPLAEFAGNVSHSNSADGLHVDGGTNEQLEPEVASYRPRENPGEDSDSVQAVFEGFTAYKNRNRGVWLRGYDHAVEGATLADNAIGATFASDKTVLQNSVLVGESANKGTPRDYEVNQDRIGEDGRSLPKPYAPDFPIRGFEYYDGKVGAEDSVFTRFEPDELREASALSVLEFTAFRMSPASYAQGLSFDDDTKRVYLAEHTPEDPSEGSADGYRSAVFQDVDGSVTGTPERVVTYDNPFLRTNDCQERDDWGAWVCAESYVGLELRTEGERESVTVARGGAEHVMYGVGNSPADTFITNVLAEETHTLAVAGGTPERFSVTLREAQGRSVTVRVPYSGEPTVQQFGQVLEASSNLGALDAEDTSGYFYGGGTLHLKLAPDSDYLRLTVE